LVVETKGKRQSGTKVINFLSPDWVNIICFKKKFVQFVIHMALTKKQKDKALLKPMESSIMRGNVPVKYQQGEMAMCV
jgi:hypothetical protein